MKSTLSTILVVTSEDLPINGTQSGKSRRSFYRNLRNKYGWLSDEAETFPYVKTAIGQHGEMVSGPPRTIG